MKLLRKIIKKIRKGIAFVIGALLRKTYEISYRLNSPKLAAIILCILTTKLNDKRKYRVLCLGRSQFIDDVNALITYSNKIQYIYFHKMLLGKIVRHFIPYTLYGGKTYHTDPRYGPGKERVYNFISGMFDILHKYLKFDAVMSGNYVFVDQQEFFKICIHRKIPCIILNKEGIAAPLYPDEGLSDMKEFRFIADKMLFINDSIKYHDIKYLKGLKTEQCTVVGIPRMDYYHKANKKYLKQIVLFAFDINDYLHFHNSLKNNLDILKKIVHKFHVNIFSFAMKHPDYNIIIKAKTGGKDFDYISNIYQDYLSGKPVDNITITHSYDVKRLILDSRVILGFNSTVLFEAIVAGKTIITPDFSKLLGSNASWDYFSEAPKCVNYANEYKDLEKTILNSDNYHNYDTKEINKFINKWIYKPDGKSNLRVEKSIIETIKSKAIS